MCPEVVRCPTHYNGVGLWAQGLEDREHVPWVNVAIDEENASDGGMVAAIEGIGGCNVL